MPRSDASFRRAIGAAQVGRWNRSLLARAGLSLQRFSEVYSQPIVLRPERFLGYGGRGWDAQSPAVAT